MKILCSKTSDWLLLFLLVFATCAVAADYRVIDTIELKAMVDSKKEFSLVDARTKDEYDEAHIQSAINIAEKTFEAQAYQLPADKKSLVVIYCNGIKCGKSRRVAAMAEKQGYANIAIYSEGFPVWEEKNLTITKGPGYDKQIVINKLKPAELKQLIENRSKDLVIVDVRDESEYKAGHMPTAINIPAENFAVKAQALPKDKKIVVYCNTGGRSSIAYKKLIKLAYPKIYQAALAEWKDSGQTLEK